MCGDDVRQWASEACLVLALLNLIRMCHNHKCQPIVQITWWVFCVLWCIDIGLHLYISNPSQFKWRIYSLLRHLSQMCTKMENQNWRTLICLLNVPKICQVPKLNRNTLKRESGFSSSLKSEWVSWRDMSLVTNWWRQTIKLMPKSKCINWAFSHSFSIHYTFIFDTFHFKWSGESMKTNISNKRWTTIWTV